MVRRHIATVLFPILVLAAGAGDAATIAPPENLGELARLSTAVVLAEALDSTDPAPVAVRSHLPHTLTRFRLIERVSGARVGERFEVVEPGGAVDSRVALVGGAPRYEAGRTYLLFLDLGDDGYWRSRMLAYGLLVEDAATGVLEPLPEAGWIDPVSDASFEAVEAYRKEALLGHLREVLAGRPWDRARAGAVPATDFQGVSTQAPGVANAPPGCSYLTDTNGLPFRWFGWETGTAAPAVIRATTPGQVGMPNDQDEFAVELGVNKWRDHPDSPIEYEKLPTAPANVSCTGDFDAEPGAVWYNDPCDDLAPLNGCAGTLAFGGFFSTPGPTQQHDGQPWHPVDPGSSFVVVNDGTECIGNVNFWEMMTHELGHTLGFGHHAATPPPDPTMSAVLKADGRGADLIGRDRTCASFVYHTFLDVPLAHIFWPFIEAVKNAEVTGGCASGLYCPAAPTTRAQMAKFILSADEGETYVPPPCTGQGPFSDVPCSNLFADWIQELVARGVTSGCGGGAFCPASPITRGQMAAFLLLAFEGAGYTPPPCVTDPFGDVDAGGLFCPWIQELVNRGVTSGCGGGNYCPGAPVTRGQMAAFLATNWALILPD